MPDAIRNLVRGLAPHFVLKWWRRFFWWNATRINPAHARKKARSLLESGTPIRLEIGSGPRGLAGWTSLDLNIGSDIQHDLTRPLPFPDACLDEVYSSHVLEHFTYPLPLLNVVRECRRVLKPGSRIRVAVPNGRIYLDAYFHPENFDLKAFCDYDVGLRFRNRMDVVNFIAHLGGEHKYLFDQENLVDLLTEAGFSDARPRQFDPAIDLAARRHESVYAEGFVPV
jgi:predicted SAM-dependent methyltransferase